MQTTEVFAETARWLRYAEEDLITAETLLAKVSFPLIPSNPTRILSYFKCNRLLIFASISFHSQSINSPAPLTLLQVAL